MKQRDFVIVGGSAAGIQATIVAQRQRQAESILVIREGQKVPVPCGVPYIYGTLGAVGRNIIPDALLGNAKLQSTGVNRHPAAMPGAREIGVKLIFDRKSGKMLGGSVCCSGIAGEIANLMAAAIVSGMRIKELAILPMGTHPVLTASPLSTHITEAACQVLSKTSAGMML